MKCDRCDADDVAFPGCCLRPVVDEGDANVEDGKGVVARDDRAEAGGVVTIGGVGMVASGLNDAEDSSSSSG
jgi:hypothetical protein